MIKDLFVDLPRYRIREIFWEGGYLNDQFDQLINVGKLDLEKTRVRIHGIEVDVYATCGANDDRYCWRLLNYGWTFYSSAVILGNEDSTGYSTCDYEYDCPLSLQHLCDNLEWCRMQWYSNEETMGMRTLTWRANHTEIEL
jgi:hypothetical protein